jgi:acetyl esterase/lipase
MKINNSTSRIKKFLLSLALLNFALVTFSQKSNYTTKLNIPYYSDSVNKTDEYIKERCVLDIYYPENVKDFSTIVWFHGGGLTGGNKEIPEALKEKNVCIVAANYRLNPKVNAPKYIEDATAAVAWVFNHINEFRGDSSLIFVSGHSAGGYLTLMLGLDKQWLKPYNIDANRIAGLIPLSGQPITHFTVRKERGIAETQPVIDEYAPLYHVRADAPPLLLITGDRELELLGRYEENAYLERMMKIVGHKETKLYELQGYGHMMTEPAFPLLLDEVGRITSMKKNLKK